MRIEPCLMSRSRYCGVPYRPELPNQHELLRVFRALTLPDCDGAYQKLFEEGYREYKLRRADPNWHVVLVKEVHALLAAEALIKAFNCPVVLLLRNPVYVIDSLFYRDGVSSVYLRHEETDVLESEFLKRFADDSVESVQRTFDKIRALCDERHRAILRKVLTIGLIQKMFSVLASEYRTVRLMRYEDFCDEPLAAFRDCAAWLGLIWNEACDKVVRLTTRGESQRKDLNMISRRSAHQTARPLRFLTVEEESICRRALSRSGLGDASPAVARSDRVCALSAPEAKE